MNYAETIDYLYSKLPLFSRIGPAAIKKDLHNTLVLCERLGFPERAFPSIHIAGTNGKGSVSHMLAAVLQKAGRKTGLYTSPHLYDFRERIRINGEKIPEARVASFVQKVKPWIGELEPSFFEITVAMAFSYFQEEEVDVAIIETGLGGRLDSTNVITPVLSVITNIGWDHINLLGDTLPAIAGEKAGIIKEGVPAVIGERHPETEPVFRKQAASRNAPLYFAEDLLLEQEVQPSGALLSLLYSDREGKKIRVRTDLAGLYQARNVRTVLASLQVLRNHHGWSIEDHTVAEALQNVKGSTGLRGRWDVLQERPLVVLDVAHNREGMAELLRHLEQLSYRQLHLVLGTVKDKDTGPVLELLPREATYYFTQAHIPRALDPGELQVAAAAYGLQGSVYPEVNEALQAALAHAVPEDVIVVCGSIFLVAEVAQDRLIK